MRTQWTTKGNRDAGFSCSCVRGLHRYLRNFGGGGLNTPNHPSVRHCIPRTCRHFFPILKNAGLITNSSLFLLYSCLLINIVRVFNSNYTQAGVYLNPKEFYNVYWRQKPTAHAAEVRRPVSVSFLYSRPHYREFFWFPIFKPCTTKNLPYCFIFHLCLFRFGMFLPDGQTWRSS